MKKPLVNFEIDPKLLLDFKLILLKENKKLGPTLCKWVADFVEINTKN